MPDQKIQMLLMIAEGVIQIGPGNIQIPGCRWIKNVFNQETVVTMIFYLVMKRISFCIVVAVVIGRWNGIPVRRGWFTLGNTRKIVCKLVGGGILPIG